MAGNAPPREDLSGARTTSLGLSAPKRDAAPVPFRTNVIYRGDCEKILWSTENFPDESVDLIYMDPPFFTNRLHEVIWNDGAEVHAFEDRWSGGIEKYIDWMEPKLRACYRVLKPTGSMYLHCDWHADGYLRMEMDKLFGRTRLINEIIWKRQSAHGDSKQGAQHFGRIHDVILFYTKSDTYTWNQQYTPYDEQYAVSEYKRADAHGRRYKEMDLTAAKPGGNTNYEWHGVRPYKGRYWAYSKDKMDEFLEQGKIIFRRTGMPRLKLYLDEMPGVGLQDVWTDIQPAGLTKERIGYPTQKPEVLLKRIIETSANPTDVILDPMCGCGTAIVEAHKLGRRWIGIDIAASACNLMRNRMAKLGVQDVQLIGMPKTLEELHQLPKFEFQDWVCDRLMGQVNPKKVGDMGVDGRLFDGSPLQVKGSDHIGREKIDEFQAAVRRTKRRHGVFVAFSFSRGAIEETARLRLHDALDIELRTVEEILNEEQAFVIAHPQTNQEKPEKESLKAAVPARRNKRTRSATLREYRS